MGLRVIEQFGEYKVGDLIADGAQAEAILKSEQAAYVVQVSDAPQEEMPRVFVTDEKK